MCANSKYQVDRVMENRFVYKQTDEFMNIKDIIPYVRDQF